MIDDCSTKRPTRNTTKKDPSVSPLRPTVGAGSSRAHIRMDELAVCRSAFQNYRFPVYLRICTLRAVLSSAYPKTDVGRQAAHLATNWEESCIAEEQVEHIRRTQERPL